MGKSDTLLAWIIHEARDLSRGAGIGRVISRGREKQDVFLAAPKDGLTAVREMPSQSRRTKKLSFMNNVC